MRSGSSGNRRPGRTAGPAGTPIAWRRLPEVVGRAIVCAAVLVAAAGAVARARPAAQQPETAPLRSGVPIERVVSDGREDVFELRVPPGRLARVVMDARGVEMLLRIRDDRGAVIVEAEDGTYENRVVLEIAAEGTHRIAVAPKYPGLTAGTYTIRSDEPREWNPQDGRLFEALREYAASVISFREESYAEARARAEAALRIREEVLGSGHPDVAFALRQLGLVLQAQGEYRAAIEAFRRSVAILERALGAEHPALAASLNGLATTERLMDRSAEALRLAERARAIAEARLGPRHALTAESLRTIADAHGESGAFAEGRAAVERALEIAREVYGEDHLEYAVFQSRAGRFVIYAGDYGRAEKLFGDTLRLRERLAGPDSVAAADSLAGLAFIALQSARNLESEELHRRVLAIREARLGSDHPDVALILNNLGLIAYRRRDHRAAEAFHLRALGIRERALGPSHSLTGHSLNNLGLVYWRQENYPKAREFFARALQVAEAANGPESLNVVSPLANLGIVSKETGDYDRAEAYYLRALAIYEKAYGPGHPQLRAMLESLGILYRDRGDYGRAEPYIIRTLTITEQAFGPDHPDVVRHLQNLFQLQAARGDRAAALASLERSARIEERHLPFNLTAGSERQKLAYFRPFASNLEEIVSFHIQKDPGSPRARDLAAATILQRKGRVLDALADGLGALARGAADEDRARLDRLRAVTSELSTLVLGGPRQMSRAAYQARIAELDAERERLEDEISRRTAGRYARHQPVTLDAIREAVPAGTALIEFVVYRPHDPAASRESPGRYGEPRYAAYVIQRGRAVQWRDLGPAAEIDDAVSAFREALRDPGTEVKRTARALDAAVMQPLRPLTAGASRLLVSPDGALSLVPFEALADEEGAYLVERFAFSYLSAGRDLLRMGVPRAAASPPLVVADPLFGEPVEVRGGSEAQAPPGGTRRSVTTGADRSAVYFAPIAGTRYEARSILTILPGARLLAGARATESALHATQAPSILHIATHGFFLDDPDGAAGTRGRAAAGTRAISAAPARIENPRLRSGLALAGANLTAAGREDGILTALEAAHLNLWGTKLVTLSACDTGVGVVHNGEGVYGLRRSIFLAGAETLVMSLWPVSDAVTRELMTAFYKGLRAGLGRGDALRQVQRAMLARPGREHPFYWASFIQAGEWGELDEK